MSRSATEWTETAIVWAPTVVVSVALFAFAEEMMRIVILPRLLGLPGSASIPVSLIATVVWMMPVSNVSRRWFAEDAMPAKTAIIESYVVAAGTLPILALLGNRPGLIVLALPLGLVYTFASMFAGDHHDGVEADD